MTLISWKLASYGLCWRAWIREHMDSVERALFLIGAFVGLFGLVSKDLLRAPGHHTTDHD